MAIRTRNSVTVVTKPYHNFAPFVRRIGERKAQTCAMGMFHQLTIWRIESPSRDIMAT